MFRAQIVRGNVGQGRILRDIFYPGYFSILVLPVALLALGFWCQALNLALSLALAIAADLWLLASRPRALRPLDNINRYIILAAIL